MAITASAPALYENGAGSNDLEDIPADGHRYRVQPICELFEASARELD